MNHIEIYTKSWCPYSIRARELLQSKGFEFEEIDVTSDLEREAEMIIRTGRTSVPQVFLGGKYIGGYDELAALDADGELDRRLSVPRPGQQPSNSLFHCD